MIILGKIVNSYLNKQISLVSWDSSSSVHSCTVQLKFKDSQVRESKFRPLSHIEISNKKKINVGPCCLDSSSEMFEKGRDRLSIHPSMYCNFCKSRIKAFFLWLRRSFVVCYMRSEITAEY